MKKYLALVAPVVLATFWALRAGLPPAGTCVDAEMVVADLDDAGGYSAVQKAKRVCNVDGADASLTAEEVCVKPTKDVCLGADWQTRDAGPRTKEQKDCLEREREICAREVPAGGIVWTSAPYPNPGETQTVTPLSRREQMQSSCACRNKFDAGMCRAWADPPPGGSGPDASRPAPYDQTLQPGRWSGAGCVAAPCVESEVREALGGPGALFPEACR